MVIQTVYLPVENIRFIKEWLTYHSEIGVEHFYLYDNTGSQFLDLGNAVSMTGRNKHNRVIENKDVTEEEAEILKDFPVTKVKWQPMKDGQIIYGQMEACQHFYQNYGKGLCAFIDIDEFIIKREEFRPSRLLQKKYDDRWNYDRVLDCKKTFEINTRNWASKCIIDMAYWKQSFSIHYENLRLPISESWFNHYNHTEIGHQWLLENYQNIDPSWKPIPYSEVFNAIRI